MKIHIFIMLAMLITPVFGRDINLEYFLPLTPGSIWKMEGTTKIKGFLVDISVETTATATSTIYGVIDGNKVIHFKGVMQSEYFTLPLYGQTRLDAQIEALWSRDDENVYAHGASMYYNMGPYNRNITNLYDSAVRVFPKFIEFGEVSPYRGTAQNGNFRVEGTFQWLDIGSGNLSIGNLDAIYVLQTSPYEEIEIGWWLSRGVELVQFEVYGEDGGYTMEVSVTTKELNRPYRIQPIYNTWDIEYRFERSPFVRDSWFGYLYDSFYPWTYMYDFGWIYVDHDNWEHFWFYSVRDGWCYTGWDVFPSVYSSLTG